MEKILKEIKTILSSHRESYSFYLYSERGSDWTTPLQHPLFLDPTKHYEIALISLETFHSIPNIRADNNMLMYSTDKGNSFRYISIPVGSYELGQINDVIASEVGTAIEIKPNTATLHSIIKISDVNVQVDMSRSTLRTVLGFNATTPEGKPNILEMGSVESENTVNIFDISNIFVHCELAGGSYFRGDLSSVLYSFFPAVGIGHKIIQRPSQPLYLPITKRGSINRIRVWITDQTGLLVNFREEDITVRLHIRSI
jgi:hypothetical protein